MSTSPLLSFADASSRDSAVYHAGAALDDLLGWFLDDGYTVSDLVDLCSERAAELAKDRADDD